MKLNCLYTMKIRALVEGRVAAAKRIKAAIDRRIAVIGGWS